MRYEMIRPCCSCIIRVLGGRLAVLFTPRGMLSATALTQLYLCWLHIDLIDRLIESLSAAKTIILLTDGLLSNSRAQPESCCCCCCNSMFLLFWFVLAVKRRLEIGVRRLEINTRKWVSVVVIVNAIQFTCILLCRQYLQRNTTYKPFIFLNLGNARCAATRTLNYADAHRSVNVILCVSEFIFSVHSIKPII